MYLVPWRHRTAADAGHGCTCRERSDLEKRLRDQISALNTRVGELDSENRKLRETKYELDTKVGRVGRDGWGSQGAAKWRTDTVGLRRARPTETRRQLDTLPPDTCRLGGLRRLRLRGWGWGGTRQPVLLTDATCRPEATCCNPEVP